MRRGLTTRPIRWFIPLVLLSATPIRAQTPAPCPSYWDFFTTYNATAGSRSFTFLLTVGYFVPGSLPGTGTPMLNAGRYVFGNVPAVDGSATLVNAAMNAHCLSVLLPLPGGGFYDLLLVIDDGVTASALLIQREEEENMGPCDDPSYCTTGGTSGGSTGGGGGESGGTLWRVCVYTDYYDEWGNYLGSDPPVCWYEVR